MDVSSISSVASAVSSQKLAQAGSESQVALSKKQGDQEAQIAATLIGSATQSATVERPDKGRLLSVA